MQGSLTAILDPPSNSVALPDATSGELAHRIGETLGTDNLIGALTTNTQEHRYLADPHKKFRHHLILHKQE
jgi:hypothetical protein